MVHLAMSVVALSAAVGLIQPRAACAQEPTIVDVPLATKSIPNGLRKYVYYMRDTPSDSERQFATWEVETSRQKYHGYPVMQRIMRFESKDGSYAIDTMLTYERTMAPLQERSYLDGKKVALDFDYRSVSIQVWLTKDFVSRRYRYVYEDPMFNGCDEFLVIGALPLKVGYHGRISAFSYEYENATTDPFQVIREDSVPTSRGVRPAWVTTLVQRGMQITLWTDRETREVLRLICVLQDQTQIRLQVAD